MRKTIHYEYGIAYVQNVKLTILKETNAPSVKNSYKKRKLIKFSKKISGFRHELIFYNEKS
jgi:hypothetical protein